MKYSLVSLLLLLHVFLNSQVIEYPISASDAEAGDKFGKSSDISGIYAVVGAYEDDNGTGSAYIFKWSGQNWMEECKLVASDGSPDDMFGTAVAIDGNYIIVGAPGESNSTGAAYFFEREGTNWIELYKVAPTDGNYECSFGTSVSISGSNAIAGAPGLINTNNNNGSVYTYTLDESVWVEDDKLVAFDGAVDDQFGYSVCIDGDNNQFYAIVGACCDDDNGWNSGSAYFFKKDGDQWFEQNKVTSSVTGDYFGLSVSIDKMVDETFAIVGTSYNNAQMRSVYIFNRDDDFWNQHYVIQDVGGDHFFGRSVAIQGDYAIIGSPRSNVIFGSGGSAYVYRRYDSYWTYQIEVSPASGDTGDNFGSSLSIDSTNVIIAAFLDDNVAINAGSASIYDMSAIIELTDATYYTINSNPISTIAFPNPFNPTTTISFSLQNNSNVELSIYNIKGQKVKQLVSDIRQLPEGQHSVVWDGTDENNQPVSSGIYFYKLKAGEKEIIRKMLLLK